MAPGDFATLRWQDPDRDQPTLDAVLAKQAELEAEARIDAVKAEARRRITQRFPDWKQANMTARGVELLNIRVAVAPGRRRRRRRRPRSARRGTGSRPCVQPPMRSRPSLRSLRISRAIPTGRSRDKVPTVASASLRRLDTDCAKLLSPR